MNTLAQALLRNLDNDTVTVRLGMVNAHWYFKDPNAASYGIHLVRDTSGFRCRWR